LKTAVSRGGPSELGTPGEIREAIPRNEKTAEGDDVVLTLNLVVVRASDPERTVRFYEALGLTFERHRHGSGPAHYSAEIGSVVFEIYPTHGPAETTQDARIGFRVTSLTAALTGLREAGGVVVTAPHASEWGDRAVAVDPDGRKVDLTAA
jgi:lactoylglutathione lyase